MCKRTDKHSHTVGEYMDAGIGIPVPRFIAEGFGSGPEMDAYYESRQAGYVSPTDMHLHKLAKARAETIREIIDALNESRDMELETGAGWLENRYENELKELS